MKSEKGLSIIIVSKDTKELLINLLGSIENDVSLGPYIKEIILVDNASADGTGDVIRSNYPLVTYIRNESNKGFAKAVNIGTAESSGEYILLLNSDTLLIKGEILKMLKFMEEHRDTGICGPQLVYPDMKRQRSFAYRPSLLLEIVPKPVLEIMHPGRYARKNQTYSAPVEVDSLIGAAIMLRRKSIELTGGFDEQFFFFLEETDLCIRVKEKGQKVIFFPGAEVIHIQGKTVRQSWVKGRIEYNISLHKFIKKYHNDLYYFIFNAVRLIKCFPALIAYSILPFLLISEKARTKYKYYFQLFIWHMRGRPEKGGLRANSPKQKLLRV
jgi:hypothetical protein